MNFINLLLKFNEASARKAKIADATTKINDSSMNSRCVFFINSPFYTRKWWAWQVSFLLLALFLTIVLLIQHLEILTEKKSFLSFLTFTLFFLGFWPHLGSSWVPWVAPGRRADPSRLLQIPSIPGRCFHFTPCFARFSDVYITLTGRGEPL